MEEKENSVPYIVYESSMARMERGKVRLWVLCIILILLLFGSNAAWIAYESQYVDEVTTETYEAETGDGGTALVNRDGSVNYYGEGTLYQNDEKASP